MFLPPCVPFWERRNSDRGRFNLLLLEYGEIYVEDLAVFYYPVLPNLNHGTNFEQCEALKQKGRLKVCSRSLVFEPSDERQPLYKFAFKALESAVEPFTLRPEEADACRAASGKLPAGFVTFRCSSYAAMKENNRVGPYKAVDCAAASARFLFAVVHADVPTLLKKIAQLRSAAGPAAAAAATAVPTPFNSSHLLDFHETLQLPEAVAASRVSPLLLHPGVLMVTDRRIYFQPSQLNNVGDAVLSVDIAAITHVYARRHLLRQRAIEVFFRDSRGPDSDTTGSIGSGSNSGGSSSKKTGSVGSSSTNSVVAAGPAVRGGSGGVAYFVFESEEARDRVLRTVAAQPCFPRSLRDLLVGSAPRAAALEDVFRRWQRREVSNFDYLMFLNVEADRSLLDLAQYPVMPHVLVDFSSDELDLADPAVFRDLSKPVGALTPQRLAFFRERYAALTAAAAPDPTTSSSSSSKTSSNKCSGSGEDPAPPPPFLYGTHYSTPGYVLYFLVRVAPEHMLCLSDGRFDAADRMFYSLPAMLDSCLHNPADLKELIPEFFEGDGAFLRNSGGLDLGRRNNGAGERIGDVDLPPWARGSPAEFVRLHRAALESEHVSAHLHEWIDLVFGCKQRGPAAVAADNVFFHLTYDLDGGHDARPSRATSAGASEPSVQSRLELEARDVQVAEFGQTPKQLFAGPHPARNDAGAAALDFAALARPSAALGGAGTKGQPAKAAAGPQSAPSSTPPAAKKTTSSATPSGALHTPPTPAAGAAAAAAAAAATSPSTASAPPPAPATSASGGIVELGDDFRAEVEREMAAAALDDAGPGAGRLVVAVRGKVSVECGDASAPAPLPAPGAAAAITSRLWGFVADTAAAVADKAGQSKGGRRLGFPLQLASRWLAADQPSTDAPATTEHNAAVLAAAEVAQGPELAHIMPRSLPVTLHPEGAVALLRLRSAATGVSAVCVGSATVVVSACAHDRGTTVVRCCESAVDAVASFVAGGEAEGAGALVFAQQVASRVGAWLPGIPPLPDAVNNGIGVGMGVGGVACRLSVDGGHVLVSAVRGSHCGLYSYALRDGAGAALVGGNVAALGAPPGAASAASRKEGTRPAPPARYVYVPCVAVGRGTQVLVAGSQSGAVALRPLALRPPTAGPGPSREGEGAFAFLCDASTPVTAVGLVPKAAHIGKGVAPADAVAGGDAAAVPVALGPFRGLYVAAGCEDGTVAVWDSDKSLARAEPPTGADGGWSCTRTALFCHQLRPTERPIVCLEWLRVLPSPTYTGAAGCAVLVTGARDGALHCVDVDRGGTVLAALDTVPPDGSRELLSLALTEAVVPSDALAPANAVSAAAFCGYSDGSVCAVHVDVGVDGSVPGRYEGVVRLAHVRLMPLFVLLANAPGVAIVAVGAWHASSVSSRANGGWRQPGGVTAMCWTQATDRPVAARADSDNDDDSASNTEGAGCHTTTSRQGYLVTGTALGEVRLWRATVYHGNLSTTTIT